MTVHPDVDFVVFTGSRDVGIRIVRRAAGTEPAQRNVKKVVAEMGGKNAIIVDETADLDEAVRGVIESAFGYQGQKCSACSRVIVAAEIFEEFTMRLGAAAESIRIGDPALPSSFMGPVIDRHAAEKIRRYAGIARTTASTLFFRDGAGSGHFISPSVFTDLPSDSPVLHDEIFGPVLAVMRSTDIDDAIRMANDTSYALTGGIYSRSPENIRKGKAALRAGNLYINRKITGAIVGRQPFGGFGMSGVGSKAGGPDYLVQFTNPVSISEETLRKGYAPS
jgi:RHH-type proline utilization regulon transcriptional repressor/proline dehydrogenase/delta 1-pyrroline-5-carboxylate dehydrogenase